MYSKQVVTWVLTLLLLCPCVIIGFGSTVIKKRQTQVRNSDSVTSDVVDIRSRFAGGDGTEDDPYQISNVNQLQDINLNLTANYTLINDIDASETREWNNGEGFTPIINNTRIEEFQFSGNLDGRGYHLTDLFINRSSDDFIGLFGYVSYSGHLSNITFINNKVNGNENVGGIVGYNAGIVENCYLTGTVTGINYMGGLIGKNDGAVENCSAMGNVSGKWFIGGLVGRNEGTLEKCSVTSFVTGIHFVGGLIGYNSGTVTNGYATGNVRGEVNIGGFVGSNGDTIENCDSSGNVMGDTDTGGFIGSNGGTIENCSSSGNVIGNWRVGGFVGQNRETVVKCYTTCNVSGEHSIGGLVGYNSDLIENSFYCINTTTINQKNIITPYGIYKKPFEQWLNNKTFFIDDYFSKIFGSVYYNIARTQDMSNLLLFAASGEYKFRQTADIDMSSQPNLYIPIFNGGEYDGSGHIISKLNVSINSISNIGLFGSIGSGTTITNVSLIENNVNGDNNTGGLVGTNEGGMVVNCYSEGSVSGNREVGGIVGINNGEINNCSSSGYVTGSENVGGLVGRNKNIVEKSSSSAYVSGHIYSGGLVGFNYGTIYHSFSEGNMSGNIGLYSRIVGGFVGKNQGTIKQCYSETIVSGGDTVGGFVGWNSGGLPLGGNIENCYSKSIVSGNNSISGFVGFHSDDIEYSGVIENCFSTGEVSGNHSVWGFKGDEVGALVNHSFWDVDSSGLLISDGGTGKTTPEMMIKSTFINVGWDFTSIWAINEYIDYPYLQWERRQYIEADDFDNDSFPNIIDDFPFDPAASLDSDKDGHPDVWSPEMNEIESTTGLHLDAFPNDPAASLDSDADGMPDEWNPGMNQSDSTSIPTLELDPYPDDPNNEVPTEKRSVLWIWISLILSVLIIISVLVVLFVARKRLSVKKREVNKNEEDSGRIKPNDR